MGKFWKRIIQTEAETRNIHDLARAAIVDEIVRTDDKDHRAELKAEYYSPTSYSASTWELENSTENYKLGKAVGRVQGTLIAIGAGGLGLGARWLIDKFFKKK